MLSSAEQHAPANRHGAFSATAAPAISALDDHVPTTGFYPDNPGAPRRTSVILAAEEHARPSTFGRRANAGGNAHTAPLLFGGSTDLITDEGPEVAEYATPEPASVAGAPSYVPPRTAPAHLGEGVHNYYSARSNNPFVQEVPMHSRWTMWQNARLSNLQNILNTGLDGNDKSENVMALKLQFEKLQQAHKGALFDKVLNDTIRLIERAKAIDVSRLSSLDETSSLSAKREDSAQTKRKREVKADKESKDEGEGPSATPNGPENSLIAGGSAATRALFEQSGSDNVAGGRHGRKPVRLILEDLASRFQTLKSSQTEWERFMIRINSYKKEAKEAEMKRPKSAHVKACLDSSQYRPESRRETRQTLKVEREQRRQTVLLRKAEKDEVLRETKMATIRKKEELLNEELRKQREVRQGQLIRRWAVFVVLGSRLMMMKKAMHEEQVRRARLVMQNIAAIRIQRRWRAWIRKVKAERQKQALEVLGRAFKEYAERKRLKKRDNNADTIRQFFIEVHECSKILKVIQKYRFSVLAAQTVSREWLTVRNDRKMLLVLQWEKYEPLWWDRRKRLAEEEEAQERKKTKRKPPPKKTKGKPTDKDEDKEKLNITKIPTEFRDLVIETSFTKRRKEWRAKFAEYYKRVDEWKERERERAKVANALASLGTRRTKSAGSEVPTEPKPKRPWFKSIISQEDVFELISAAYKLYEEKQAPSAKAEKGEKGRKGE